MGPPCSVASIGDVKTQCPMQRCLHLGLSGVISDHSFSCLFLSSSSSACISPPPLTDYAVLLIIFSAVPPTLLLSISPISISLFPPSSPSPPFFEGRVPISMGTRISWHFVAAPQMKGELSSTGCHTLPAHFPSAY